MLAEDDAFHVGIFTALLFHDETEVEARPLPGHPAHLVAVYFSRQPLLVLAGGDGDDGVGMGVVYVLLGHEGVQRGVDGAGAGIEVEDGVRIVADHFVFDSRLDAFFVGRVVNALQLMQFLQVEGGEVGALGRAQIAAGAFDPQHVDLLAGQGIFHGQLGGGVAAAGVGDALVTAQQVGTVHQAVDAVHAGRFAVVPKIVYVFELFRHGSFLFDSL